MKEIKISFPKGSGGKARIKANKQSAGEMSAFTEKLAKELGNIEERHRATSSEGHFQQDQQQEKQSN